MGRVILDPYSDYDNNEELTPIEKKINRKETCRIHAAKFTDDYGHTAIRLYECLDVTCPKCLASRIELSKKKLSYLDSNNFVYKQVLNIDMTSLESQDYSINMFHEMKKEFKLKYPTLWFRLILTGKYIAIALNNKDFDVLKGEEITYNQIMSDFMDFRHVTDIDAYENLVITHKGERRILGHGKKPSTPPEACCLSVKTGDKKDDIHHALKRKGEDMTVEETANTKLPPAKFMPVEMLMYAVSDPTNEHDHLTLTFSEFVKHRIAGGYLDEWEEYHGDFESKRMQVYLKWLLDNQKGSKTWDFLKDYFKDQNKSECTFG